MARAAKLLKPFADAIHAKALALRSLELTRQQRATFIRSIGDDIRKCTDLLTPMVTRAAAAKAAALGVDLRATGWHDQPKFDFSRKVFHYEHSVTVADLRRLCMSKRTAAGVLRVLTTKPRVVWMLKAEDRRLTALGYRSKRADPEAAYYAARIRLAE